MPGRNHLDSEAMRLPRPTSLLAALVAVGFAVAAMSSAKAQSFTVLHGFTNSPDGANPYGGLVRDAAGNLYGTTLSGACTGYGCGTVFRIDSLGNEGLLSIFGKGGLYPLDPYATLIRDAAGNVYGTTRDGGSYGYGTVFKVDTSSGNLTWHSLTIAEGANPYAGLIMDAAGNLYGTTSAAGLISPGVLGAGTVFKVDPAGNVTVLHVFAGSPDGGTPTGGLVMDAAGNLYGTTYGGGPGFGLACPLGCGTVFKIDLLGNESILYSFTNSPDGAGPQATLIMDAAGNLYGTTSYGGTPGCGNVGFGGGCGTVFKVDTSGHETVLYRFNGGAAPGTSGNDGANPVYAGLVADAAGNLYGTTEAGGSGLCTGSYSVVVGCGTVFKLDTSGHETILHDFRGGSDGASPQAGLVMDAAGNLYGTASFGAYGTTSAGGPCTVGGGWGGCGTVFKIAPLTTPTPTITSISPTSAIAGGAAFALALSGTNFISSSAVSFNGNARATTFVSATQLTAAILASDIAVAGSFNVTVTNPAPGGGTSNAVSFTVQTPQQATQFIINSVNMLYSQRVLNAGQDNSVVKMLQQAINLMNVGKNAGAIANLESFISEVNDLRSSGVLSPSQAAPLISAAQTVITAIS